MKNYKIKDLINDKPKFFKNATDFLFQSRGKTLIVVFDNADKKDKDTQLLMFEVANWFKSTFNCTVFLPIRDVTFDHYRNSPPLDTLVKDLVFRIEPPLLEQVIFNRFKFFTREINSDDSKFYYTSRSYRIGCRRSEVKNYLSSILKSLFSDHFFRRLITGISERDMRRGLEIFLDFVKSGHITEEMILKMRISERKDFKIPNHLISRILLRSGRRYYSDSESKIKNLFYSLPTEEIPDPFLRISILKWLQQKKSVEFIEGMRGYMPIKNMVSDLQNLGHNPERISDELKKLFDARCLITETQSKDFDENNLLSISVTGNIHLELLNNLDYLSTVSEDVWYDKESIAQSIANNINTVSLSEHLSKKNAYENSKYLVDYLVKYKNNLPFKPELFLETSNQKPLLDFTEINAKINSFRDKHKHNLKGSILSEIYPSGSTYQGQISGLKKYGIFVEFGLEAVGLISINSLINYHDPTYIESHYEIGEFITIKVVKFNTTHDKFDLVLA